MGGGLGVDPKLHRMIVGVLVTVAMLLLSDPVLEILDEYNILPVGRSINARIYVQRNLHALMLLAAAS